MTSWTPDDIGWSPSDIAWPCENIPRRRRENKRGGGRSRPNAVDHAIAETLLTTRTGLGVSQQTLAQEAGLSFGKVQRCERGRARIRATDLWRISRVLGVSIDHFFQPGDTILEAELQPSPELALHQAINQLPTQLRDSLLVFLLNLVDAPPEERQGRPKISRDAKAPRVNRTKASRLEAGPGGLGATSIQAGKALNLKWMTHDHEAAFERASSAGKDASHRQAAGSAAFGSQKD